MMILALRYSFTGRAIILKKLSSNHSVSYTHEQGKALEAVDEQCLRQEEDIM